MNVPALACLIPTAVGGVGVLLTAAKPGRRGTVWFPCFMVIFAIGLMALVACVAIFDPSPAK